MLRSLVDRLSCPACQSPHASLVLRETDRAVPDSPHVEHGTLVCDGCAASYPIVDGLAEIVPPVLHADQLKQREHFDWYADNAEQSYEEYQQTPFWRAADAQVVERWKPLVRDGSWMLDVGCADGRGGLYFVTTPGATLIGFDISRKMVANAIRRAKRDGFYDRASFLVADADNLPFKSGSFDIAITFGVLHHLPDPAKTSRDLQRVLRAGGHHLAYENNLTIARPIFDFMMRILPLWTEEAGQEPLISIAMVRDWMKSMPVRVTSVTSVFAPPHLLNWLGPSAARSFLKATDAVCGILPFVKGQGGLITFEIEKR